MTLSWKELKKIKPRLDEIKGKSQRIKDVEEDRERFAQERDALRVLYLFHRKNDIEEIFELLDERLSVVFGTGSREYAEGFHDALVQVDERIAELKKELLEGL